jgi:predicted RNase H-like nuclease
MSRVVEVTGLDGTQEGWVAVIWTGPHTPASAQHVATGLLRKFIATSASSTIVIDIPIGFVDKAERGGRICDRRVRKDLTRLRGSSVFPTPVRGVLAAKSHKQASKINRDSSPHRIGVTVQAYNLLRKLLEVDALMTPKLQQRVYEGHPEFSFFLMQGCRPMEYKKNQSAVVQTESKFSFELVFLMHRCLLPNAKNSWRVRTILSTQWRCAGQRGVSLTRKLNAGLTPTPHKKTRNA